MRSYKLRDNPPKRVKPALISLVTKNLRFAYKASPAAKRQAIANMIGLGFFFYLRPGEYMGTTTDDQTFSIQDVTFFMGSRCLSNAAACDDEITNATAVHLTFTTQKNGTKGEILAHSRSRDHLCCPVLCAARQVLYHRFHSRRMGRPYSGATTLATYYNSADVLVSIKPTMVTSTLRWHAGILEPRTGIPASSITAHSLRAGGAMALLTGGYDVTTIQLVALAKLLATQHAQRTITTRTTNY